MSDLERSFGLLTKQGGFRRVGNSGSELPSRSILQRRKLRDFFWAGGRREAKDLTPETSAVHALTAQPDV